MDAKSRFIRFFEKEGVEFRLSNHHHDMFSRIQQIPESACQVLTVFTTRFYFDADGNYVGVEGSEPGQFAPPRAAKPEAERKAT